MKVKEEEEEEEEGEEGEEGIRLTKVRERVEEASERERERERESGARSDGGRRRSDVPASGSCIRRANNLVSNHLTHVTRWL